MDLKSVKFIELDSQYGFEYAQVIFEVQSMGLSSSSDTGLIVVFTDREKYYSISGFYSSYRDGVNYRRFTGGPNYNGLGLCYIGYSKFFNGALDRLYEEACSLVESLGYNVETGYIEGDGSVVGVLGVTKFGDVGVIEVLLDPHICSDIIDKLVDLHGFVNKVEDFDPKAYSRYVWRYRSKGWIRYLAGEGVVSERIGREDGFNMKVSFDFHDIYIKRAYLDGCFYASPPSRPYSLMAFFRGAQVNELIFHQVKSGFRHMDLYGISYEEIDMLFDGLFVKASKYLGDV